MNFRFFGEKVLSALVYNFHCQERFWLHFSRCSLSIWIENLSRFTMLRVDYRARLPDRCFTLIATLMLLTHGKEMMQSRLVTPKRFRMWFWADYVFCLKNIFEMFIERNYEHGKGNRQVKIGKEVNTVSTNKIKRNFTLLRKSACRLVCCAKLHGRNIPCFY